MKKREFKKEGKEQIGFAKNVIDIFVIRIVVGIKDINKFFKFFKL